MNRWVSFSALLLSVAGCAESQNLQGFDDEGGTEPDSAHPEASAGKDGGSTEASSPESQPGSDAARTDSAAPGATHVLLFGGLDANGNGVLGDTWDWDGTTWTEITPTAGVSPLPRAWPAGAALDGKVVMFGGEKCLLPPPSDCDVGDTWTFSGSTWTQQSVVGPAAYHGALASTLGSNVVLWGVTGPDDFPQTWSYNGTKWTQNDLCETGPSEPIDWTATTFDNQFYLIQSGGYWAWNGSTWSSMQLNGGPSEGGNAAATTLGSNIVLFGGDDPCSFGSLNQTWTWNGSAWSAQNPSGAVPGARSSAMMATVNGTALLFGGCQFGTDEGGDAGSVGTICFGDTWTWDGTNWTEHSVSGPSPRGAALMVAY
jgi:hypothetical protein